MLKNLNFFLLPEVEEKVLKLWKERDVFRTSVALRQAQGVKNFVFYEGPPTANGRPGIHHVLTRSFKDVVLRYKTMQGYYAPRRAGWDTHGLPVELQVEKELGLKSKKEIEEYGVEKFNEKCRESVWQYKTEWEELTRRMGFWIDMENPYITYENSYIEAAWGILRQIWKKKLLYKGHRVVPWCTRCGTALSSHELAQGYQTDKDTSVYVKFRLHPGQKIGEFTTDENTYVLSWTTTPWTLPGNVALAAGKDIEYAIFCKSDLKNEGGEFSIATNPDEIYIASLDYYKKGGVGGTELLRTIKGKDLVGLQYEQLFPVKALQNEKSHRIYAADFVNTEDGTGVVHTAVMYGEDDYRLGDEVGLPKRHTVDEAGKFTSDVHELEGMYAKGKKTEEEIVNHLEVEGYLLKAEEYEHEYPHCWRCGTALLYYAHDSWFIAMTKVREKLVKSNSGINWVPEHIREGRMGEWLRDVKDWAISRNRFWGTPLPIWECAKCGKEECIGSIAELEKRSKKELSKDFDLHKPFVDEVIFFCTKRGCGGEMKRVEEVIDVWFDSGAMPFAQDSGLKKKEKSGYPADYIVEGIDQTRGWFYTLLAIATLLGKKAPYKTAVSLGLILDKDGQKMSKSKGNTVNPWEMMQAHGADVLRWHFYTMSAPGEAKRFDEEGLKQVSRQVFGLMYNSFVFYDTYADKSCKLKAESFEFSNVLDRWVVARLQEIIESVMSDMDVYEMGRAARTIQAFAEDVSRWYIRRSRARLQKPESDEDYEAASATLRHILLELSKLLAPFTPFFSEALYQSLSGEKQSVHLEDFPSLRRYADVGVEKGGNKKLLADMQKVREVVEVALAKRAEAGIKVRQPLRELRIKNNELRGKEELLEVLKDEVNVKEVAFDEKQEEEVVLDTEIPHELWEEGVLRELVRTVQKLRQDAGLHPKDEIGLGVDGADKIRSIVERNEKALKRDVGARQVEHGTFKYAAEVQTKIEGMEIRAGIRKLG